jgi:hypothetical protein
VSPTQSSPRTSLFLRVSVSVEELVQRLEWLKEQVELRGSKTHWEGDAGQSLNFALKTLSSSLEDSDSSDVIRPLQFALPSTPRGLTIKESVRMEISAEEIQSALDVAFSRVLLSHYRNQLIHLFVAEAMMALSVSRCLPCTQTTALKRFETLHCALAREFVLPLSSPRELFASTLMSLVDRGYLILSSREEDSISLNDRREGEFHFLQSLLQPFVEGVWVVCQHLLSFNGGVQSLSTTIRNAQRLGIKCITSGKIMPIWVYV